MFNCYWVIFYKLSLYANLIWTIGSRNQLRIAAFLYNTRVLLVLRHVQLVFRTAVRVDNDGVSCKTTVRPERSTWCGVNSKHSGVIAGVRLLGYSACFAMIRALLKAGVRGDDSGASRDATERRDVCSGVQVTETSIPP